MCSLFIWTAVCCHQKIKFKLRQTTIASISQTISTTTAPSNITLSAERHTWKYIHPILWHSFRFSFASCMRIGEIYFRFQSRSVPTYLNAIIKPSELYQFRKGEIALNLNWIASYRIENSDHLSQMVIVKRSINAFVSIWELHRSDPLLAACWATLSIPNRSTLFAC